MCGVGRFMSVLCVQKEFVAKALYLGGLQAVTLRGLSEK